MERTRKPKRDDEAQSQRFIEMARELGAESNDEKFERVFKKVVPPRSNQPKKRDK